MQNSNSFRQYRNCTTDKIETKIDRTTYPLLQLKTIKKQYGRHSQDQPSRNRAQLENYLLLMRSIEPINAKSTNAKQVNKLDLKQLKSKERLQKRDINIELSNLIKRYLQSVKQINQYQFFVARKLLHKIIKLLQSYPAISNAFIIKNQNKNIKSKLNMVQQQLASKLKLSSIPLLEQLITKIEEYKREAQDEQVKQIGNRIVLLSTEINKQNKIGAISLEQRYDSDNINKIFKYNRLERSIDQNVKQYGQFSSSIQKYKRMFKNLNKIGCLVQNNIILN